MGSLPYAAGVLLSNAEALLGPMHMLTGLTRVRNAVGALKIQFSTSFMLYLTSDTRRGYSYYMEC